MSKLDVVILTEEEIPERDDGGTGLQTEEHALEDQIEKLERAWPVLLDRLGRVLERAGEVREQAGSYGLESVQFQVGIEGGFTLGLTGTANAALTLKFSRAK